MFGKYQIELQKNNANKPIVEVQTNNEVLDFTEHKTKRRQQYLHKTYTNNVRVLNALLNLAIEEDNINLQKIS